MMVRRYCLPKEDQAGITIAFLWVAQYLVVSAVLLDDVNDMFERRIPFGRPCLFPAVRFSDSSRIVRQLRWSELGGTDPQSSVELPQVVSHRLCNWLSRSRTVRIRVAPVTLAAQSQQLTTRVEHCRWVPVCRYAPFEAGLQSSRCEVDFSETSKTARALLSASATNNLDPSGDKASALGVLPSEGPLVAASLMYSNTFFFFVSSTAI